jgi:hypothetical protein
MKPVLESIVLLTEKQALLFGGDLAAGAAP